MNTDSITIDGVGPMPVERPATVAELCDVIRRCAADGTAIYPAGGGTMLDYGMPPARPGIVLSTVKLDQVIDFPARDMTITVQAAITLARLQEITQSEGLWLPIDVANPEQATLGGAIAANVSGPRRYGYGTFRDYVIGITLVNDRGEEAKAGGRVVKNVAGYDLMKLYTGSLGTLGAITQVTLKLKPVPEAWSSWLFFCARQQLAEALDLLHGSATRPSVVSFRRAEQHDKTSDIHWVFVVVFDGSPEAVAWQQDRLREELTAHGFPDGDGNRGQGILPQEASESTAPFVFRASLRPSGAAAFCLRAAQSAHVGLQSNAAGAVVRGNLTVDPWTGNAWTAEGAHRLVTTLLEAARTADGNVVIERCPTEWKKGLPIWGHPPTDLALQKAVKRALDPKGLFNPGRFVTDVG